jgi:hypothetical protein
MTKKKQKQDIGHTSPRKHKNNKDKAEAQS